MSEPEGKVITHTSVGRRRARVGDLFENHKRAQGIVLPLRSSDALTTPVARPKVKADKRKVWRGKTVELARHIKNLYDSLTPEERIRRFGRAVGRENSSLKKAFEWACREYEHVDGSDFTPGALASSRY